MEVRRQDRHADRLRAEPCGAGHVRGLAVAAEEAGLVAHRVEDAGREQPVVGGVGECEGLDEVALGEPVQAGVVGHPRGELGGLASGGVQRAADGRRAAGAEQSRQLGAEVLDEGVAGVSAAERAVEPVEGLPHRAQPLDVGSPMRDGPPLSSSGCWEPTSQAIAASFQAATLGGAWTSARRWRGRRRRAARRVPALSSGCRGRRGRRRVRRRPGKPSSSSATTRPSRAPSASRIALRVSSSRGTVPSSQRLT